MSAILVPLMRRRAGRCGRAGGQGSLSRGLRGTVALGVEVGVAVETIFELMTRRMMRGERREVREGKNGRCIVRSGQDDDDRVEILVQRVNRCSTVSCGLSPCVLQLDKNGHPHADVGRSLIACFVEIRDIEDSHDCHRPSETPIIAVYTSIKSNEATCSQIIAISNSCIQPQ